MGSTMKKLIPALLTAALFATSFFAAARAEERKEYVKHTTYVTDPEKGVRNGDRNWDLLFDAYSEGGSIGGYAATESGWFGVGFRRPSPGRGTVTVSFDLKMPEGKTAKYVQVGLRLGDYTDTPAELKGFYVCVNSIGKLGLSSANGKKVEGQETGYPFTEGRKVYIEDNADLGEVTVYFEDQGNKVEAARCRIDGSTVTMEYADGSLSPVSVNYRHEIHKDGYISVLSSGLGTVLSELSVTLPSYSFTEFENDTETVVGSGADEAEGDAGNESGASKNDTSDTRSGSRTGLLIGLGAAGAVLIATAAVAAVMLVKGKKKAEGPEA
jgi:hypothetical protein